MKHIKALGFDLFNTLITAASCSVDLALGRLIESLRQSGLAIEDGVFKQAHWEAAVRFVEESRKDGRETHNRYWISAALKSHGYSILPEDPIVSEAVDSYFSAFSELCHLIPGTIDTLRVLKARYRLGLLSNFTHWPAAREIINRAGLTPFFDAILISGQIGYRKPHPIVFRSLLDTLGVGREEIIYIGDDPEPDINGAFRAGIMPVWSTCVRDSNMSYASGVIFSPSRRPERQVPRISTWNDLLALLEIQ